MRVQQQAHWRRVRGHRSQLLVSSCVLASPTTNSPHVLLTCSLGSLSLLLNVRALGCPWLFQGCHQSATTSFLCGCTPIPAIPLHGARNCCARGDDTVFLRNDRRNHVSTVKGFLVTARESPRCPFYQEPSQSRRARAKSFVSRKKRKTNNRKKRNFRSGHLWVANLFFEHVFRTSGRLATNVI